MTDWYSIAQVRQDALAVKNKELERLKTKLEKCREELAAAIEENQALQIEYGTKSGEEYLVLRQQLEGLQRALNEAHQEAAAAQARERRYREALSGMISIRDAPDERCPCIYCEAKRDAYDALAPVPDDHALMEMIEKERADIGEQVSELRKDLIAAEARVTRLEEELAECREALFASKTGIGTALQEAREWRHEYEIAARNVDYWQKHYNALAEQLAECEAALEAMEEQAHWAGYMKGRSEVFGLLGCDRIIGTQPMECGHPQACLKDDEGRAYCAWCKSLEQAVSDKIRELYAWARNYGTQHVRIDGPDGAGYHCPVCGISACNDIGGYTTCESWIVRQFERFLHTNKRYPFADFESAGAEWAEYKERSQAALEQAHAKGYTVGLADEQRLLEDHLEQALAEERQKTMMELNARWCNYTDVLLEHARTEGVREEIMKLLSAIGGVDDE